MTQLVVDASIAIKWVLWEDHAMAARHVLSTREMLAPHLLWAEVGNAIWKRQRRRESSLEEACRQLSDVRELPVRTFSHWPLMPTALDLAMSLGQTVYDCLYLALAEEEDCVVVTADRRFHRVVAESVWADRVVWIEDMA
jgi:predicted nucleic acid-binding protein